MVRRLRATLRRRWVRWGLFAAAVLVALGGALLIELLRIKSDLDAGRQAIADIDLITVGEQGGIAAVAQRAVDRFDAAEDRARSSPVLRLLSTVPVLGSQVDAVRDITGAVAEVGERGLEAAQGIEGALGAGSGPEGRLAVVRAAQDEMATLADSLAGVDLGARGWLLPPLHAVRRSLAIELADARSDLQRSTTLVTALEDFLVGPRRYLVLGGNNAEMRAVGIPTTSGVATIGGGAIEVGEFSGAVEGIELPEPGVPVSLEYEALYGWLNGDRGYRTTLATANWPVAADIAADITAQNVYGPVDGVIYVDMVTLTALLTVVGPVEVDGVKYAVGNTLDELLYRNYLRFETIDDNPERKRLQSEIAQAIFEALDTRDYDVLRLAGQLSAMAGSRHLLAWSSDPAENELWQAFGADGALQRDTIGVISQELGASKLDYFVDLHVELDATDEGDHRRVTMRIEVVNPKHPETSPYIDGGGIYASPGEYGSFLLSYLPGEAFDIAGDPGFSHFGPDGPTYAVGSINRVPEGSVLEAEVSFSVPSTLEVLSVLPSARLRPATWVVDGEETTDLVPFDIDLTSID